MREVGFCDEDRDGAVGYLRVRIVCSHDAIDIAHHDRFDLKRAEFAVFAARMIGSV